jgi:hypothetical protein
MRKTGTQLLNALNDQKIETEPAITTGGKVAAGAGAVYLILRYLLPNVPDDLVNAIVSLLMILMPIITAWAIRHKVWSSYSVHRVNDAAIKQALMTTKVIKSGHLNLIATDEITEKPTPEFGDKQL